MIFSIIGLIADIVGALLLFKFGLPSKQLSEEGDTLTVGVSDEDRAKIKRHNSKISFWAHVGLILLILGFVGQLIGTIIQRP